MRSTRTAVRSFTMAGKTSSAPSIPPAANSTDSSLNPQAKAHQLPTDFPDKPKKKTSAQTANKQAALVTPEEKEYRLQKKLCALTQAGVRVLQSLRQSLDARPDTRQRQLLVSGDGSYTNRTVLRQLPERTTFIGRIRKDAKLFLA